MGLKSIQTAKGFKKRRGELANISPGITHHVMTAIHIQCSDLTWLKCIGECILCRIGSKSPGEHACIDANTYSRAVHCNNLNKPTPLNNA